MINGHGNNLYNYAKGEIKIDFSSNIAFNNQSDRIIEFLKDNLVAIKNYPDPCANTLRDKIAIHHHVKPQEILVTNGSAEAFYLIAHFLRKKGCRTLIHTPAFAEYEDSCKLYNHDLHYKNIDNFVSTDFTDFGSTWLGKPNNPNGYCIKSDLILEKCQQYPNCYFIVDKAYNDLSDTIEFETYIPPNLVLVNSLTKSFGIPGIRLGYVIASEEIIEKLQAMCPPWNVNSLSLIAGEYIMDNYKSLQPNIDELLDESRSMQAQIDAIDGFKVLSSTCNFFLCEINSKQSAKQLKKHLIDSHGILIRDASNFRGLSDNYFRIAVQNKIANEQLVKALKQWK